MCNVCAVLHPIIPDMIPKSPQSPLFYLAQIKSLIYCFWVSSRANANAAPLIKKKKKKNINKFDTDVQKHSSVHVNSDVFLVILTLPPSLCHSAAARSPSLFSNLTRASTGNHLNNPLILSICCALRGLSLIRACVLKWVQEARGLDLGIVGAGQEDGAGACGY